jgi:excisionase family DNA binding protein
MRTTPVLLTLPETAERLGVSLGSVYRLLEGGRLPSVALGRSRRVRSDDLDKFIGDLPSVEPRP